MGSSQSQCQSCPSCETCACPQCLNQEVFQCNTELLKDPHEEKMATTRADFEDAKDAKETKITSIQTDIDNLEAQENQNKNTILTLVESINGTGKDVSDDYSAGLGSCLEESKESISTVTTCEQDKKSPELESRQQMCKKLRSATDLTDTLNGQGWAQCDCPNGTLEDDHLICSGDQTSCASCNEGFWMKSHENFKSCEPLLECELGATYETKAPTPTSNRECSPVRTCPNGQFEAEAPTLTRNRVCQTKQCVCTNGTPTRGVDCPSHGQEDCSRCNDDSQLIDSICVYKQCRCTNGTPAEGADCEAHNLRQCASCNDGYNKTDYNYCVHPEFHTRWYGDDSADVRNMRMQDECGGKGLSYEGVYESRDDPNDTSWFIKKKQYRGLCEHKIWSGCFSGTDRDTKIKEDCEQRGLTFVPGESEWKACSGNRYKGNCLPPVWTGCYSDNTCSGGDRDVCIKKECEEKGLTYTSGVSDWAVCREYSGVFYKGRCA